MAEKKIIVDLVNTKSKIEMTGGMTIAELVEMITKDKVLGQTVCNKTSKLKLKPICARVNNKTESLDFAIYSPKTVELLDATSDSGNRAYVRSLCMMLYAAVHKLYPEAKLRIEHSVSNGYYCLFPGIEVTTEIIGKIDAEMRLLHEAAVPFERHERPRTEVIEIFRRQGLDDKVALLESIDSLYTVFHTLGDVADSYYGCLAPDTSYIDVFALTPYKDGALLRSLDKSNPTECPPIIDQEKMFNAFTKYTKFNDIIGLKNVGELNRVKQEGRTDELINVAEALHEKYISRIADDITERYHNTGTRVVFIAGPSSSGKTTFTKRLGVHLRTNLLTPIQISLDDYFVDREHTPLDEDGDYDFESLYALDLDQFNSDLNDIIAGREIALPTYSFETGKRIYTGNTVKLDERSIILIEGIHGLNPELTTNVDERYKYFVYVSALTTLSIDDHNWVPTTDNRLLRRIIRDSKYRGTSALETLRRWPSVRRGEERWIFPFQENADAMFNSSLLFELGVMKSYGETVLSAVPNSAPEYAQAYRLRKFLSYFNEISSEMIPPTSLLREFLGGSSFRY